MNILVDARPLFDRSPGGVTRVASGLLPALVRAMPEADFQFATTGWKPMVSRATGITPTQKKIPNKLWSLLCFLHLTSFENLAATKPDLLFLPNLAFVGVPKIPYALVVHDVSFLIEPRWFSFRTRWWHPAVNAERLIKNAKYLFVVSERTKRDLIERLNIPAERIIIIPLGISDVGAHGDASLPPTLQGKRYVLALGANDPRKNVGCAVEAVNELKKNPSFQDVQFVLIGRDYHRPTDEALATLMKHASAFLYPSWYEGFGLPLHEAARFGTPCVASTAGALPETAPHGTIFAPPSKPQLWTEAMTQILNAPERYRTKTALGDWSEAAEIIKKQISL